MQNFVVASVTPKYDVYSVVKDQKVDDGASVYDYSGPLGAIKFSTFYKIGAYWFLLENDQKSRHEGVWQEMFEEEYFREADGSPAIRSTEVGPDVTEDQWSEIVAQLGNLPVVKSVIDFRLLQERKKMPLIYFGKGTCRCQAHPDSRSRIGGSESTYCYFVNQDGIIIEGWRSVHDGPNCWAAKLSDAEVQDVNAIIRGATPQTETGSYFIRYMADEPYTPV